MSSAPLGDSSIPVARHIYGVYMLNEEVNDLHWGFVPKEVLKMDKQFPRGFHLCDPSPLFIPDQ